MIACLLGRGIAVTMPWPLDFPNNNVGLVELSRDQEVLEKRYGGRNSNEAFVYRIAFAVSIAETPTHGERTWISRSDFSTVLQLLAVPARVL